MAAHLYDGFGPDEAPPDEDGHACTVLKTYKLALGLLTTGTSPEICEYAEDGHMAASSDGVSTT